MSEIFNEAEQNSFDKALHVLNFGASAESGSLLGTRAGGGAADAERLPGHQDDDAQGAACGLTLPIEIARSISLLVLIDKYIRRTFLRESRAKLIRSRRGTQCTAGLRDRACGHRGAAWAGSPSTRGPEASVGYTAAYEGEGRSECYEERSTCR